MSTKRFQSSPLDNGRPCRLEYATLVGRRSLTNPLPKVKQLPREQIVDDICQLILVMPLTRRQLEQLYDAITQRREKENQ